MLTISFLSKLLPFFLLWRMNMKVFAAGGHARARSFPDASSRLVSLPPTLPAYLPSFRILIQKGFKTNDQEWYNSFFCVTKTRARFFFSLYFVFFISTSTSSLSFFLFFIQRMSFAIWIWTNDGFGQTHFHAHSIIYSRSSHAMNYSFRRLALLLRSGLFFLEHLFIITREIIIDVDSKLLLTYSMTILNWF